MTRPAGHGDARSFDPDATVALPIAPGGSMNAPTVALPTRGGAGATTPPPARPPPPAAPAGDAGSVARNSAMMAVGSPVSRITGFLRTAVLAAAIGGKLVAD